jgi:transcriptional regulator with XRE-family HTH domain
MGAARSAADEPADPDRSTAASAWGAQMNALGGFIRGQRQLAKLSLREMAALTSVSNAYLSQIERGLHQPSLKVLHSIADALQLSTEQLLAQAGWVGTPSPAAAPDQADERAEAPAGGTEEAIRSDPRLSPEQRAALLSVYRSFIEGTPPVEQ